MGLHFCDYHHTFKLTADSLYITSLLVDLTIGAPLKAAHRSSPVGGFVLLGLEYISP